MVGKGLYIAVGLTGSLCSCADEDGPSAVPPAAPAGNDPAYTVSGLRSWYLIPNQATPGHQQLRVEVSAPAGVENIDVWLDGGPGVRLLKRDTLFQGNIDIAGLGPGEHEVVLGAGGAHTGFARFTIRRSHPMYVLVTTDWDISDPGDDALAVQDLLRQDHPALKLTHFVGPYTFTDPEVAPERVAELVTWLETARDRHGDEIGLHIHPYCNFVDTVAGAGGCRTRPSFVYEDGDDSGYTVPCTVYSEAEFTALLDEADNLFQAHGLEKPTAFRAGGWTADISTLRALEAAGYVTDSSANNWRRMEEWDGLENGFLYQWNMLHWSAVDDTSQPYYPSVDDILSADEPTVGVLELPDNGILVDYVTIQEMVDIFWANWSGAPLTRPTAYSIGFHPSPYFPSDEYFRMTGILAYIDQFLAVTDDGPVVYGLQSEMATVWKTTD